MSKNINIKIEKRDFSVNPKQLRASGKVPATIYGHGFEPVSVQLDSKNFQLIYKSDNKTAIFELSNDKDSYSALVKKVQFNPVNDNILNIEFYRIKTDEKLKISIPVVLIGEAPGAKMGGLLWNPLSEIEVECLPKDIPSKIEVDITGLENTDDTIMVGDVKFPSGVTPVTSSDSMIVRINAPASEKPETTETTEEVAELVQS